MEFCQVSQMTMAFVFLPSFKLGNKMSLDNLPAGKELPEDIYVVVEIPQNSDPVKYEVDHDTG